MKIFLIVAIFSVGAGWVLLGGGYRSTHVTDVRHPFSISAQAPFLHTYGGVFIIVEGSLDGGALLVVKSRCRHEQDIELKGASIATVYGGQEEWLSELEVVYQPGTAKSGELQVSLYCGARLSRADWGRYHRIHERR